MSEREFSYRWSWILPADPEALWPLVSDTNRFNRDAGLPPVEDARSPDERLPNARRRLRLRVKGIVLEWEELPFEWHRPHRFGVVRRYSRGPLREMRVLARMEAVEAGVTRLAYHVSARPRGLVGLLTTPVQIGLISRFTFGRVFRRYARAAAQEGATVAPAPAALRGSTERVKGARAHLEAEGVDPTLADRLIDHVRTADDMTLARIRPYELARRWGMARREVLTAFLHGTRGGVFDLSWDIICPVCNGAKDGARTLRELRTGLAHCDTCLIDFSPEFDQSVEVSFRPAPALRPVLAPPFCVAGPQTTPEVAVQQLLAGGESREVQAVLQEGRHRVRAFGVAGGPTFHVEDAGAERGQLSLLEDGSWSTSAAALARTVHLTLHNGTEEERLFAVERLAWADTAATAAEVTALPGFRELFTSEVLAAGDFVSVGNLAVLFTDLKSSTRLYRRIGDAPAFGRVMRHFDVLKDVVEREGGAVVKTIGDAVMAVFQGPDAAVRAVTRGHAALSTEGGEDDALVLKAGLHYGPCIAVTLNERLDYFGTTVNVAARLGAFSAGGDLVTSDAVRKDPEVQRLLAELGATVVSSTVDIQGIDGRTPVWRITVPRDGDTRA